MRAALRRHARTFTMALTLVLVGVAGVASADQICLSLDDGLLGSPSLLYRLNFTYPGNNTIAIVGSAFQGAARRVVTGGGTLGGGQLELSLSGTDIVTPTQSGGTPLLVITTTHVLLPGPTFQTGTFEAIQLRFPEPGQATGPAVGLSDGTVASVECPPQG